MKCVRHIVFAGANRANASQTSTQRDRANPRNGLPARNTQLGIAVANARPIEGGISDKDRAVESDAGFVDQRRADCARPIDSDILRTAELGRSRNCRNRALRIGLIVIGE